MNKRGIVTGKHAQPKWDLAKQFRRKMTPAERALWEAIRNNRLDGLHFRRQQIIDGFLADFYFHAAGLVLEVDGGVHDGQAEYDAERERILRERGLRVLRLRNDDILCDLAGVLDLIKRTARHSSDVP